MAEAFFPHIEIDQTRSSPSSHTMGDVLPASEFADLYVTVRDEGLPYFARVNGKGEVEVYIVYESIESFQESTQDVSTIEFTSYRDSLLAIIWTVTDPIRPLGFPLAFHCKNERERFMALQLANQPQTSIYHLLFSDDLLIHIYTETVVFSEKEKHRVVELVQQLYESMESVPVPDQIPSISAASLPDQVLDEEGTAYIFDYGRLIDRCTEEAASTLLMNTLHQSLLVMRRHSRSEVRESSCTIWVAESENFLSIYITPNLSSLFEADADSEGEANPFARFLCAIPEFVATEKATPLRAGAYPIFRFERSNLYHLELEETIQEKLAGLYETKIEKNAGKNPYLSKI